MSGSNDPNQKPEAPSDCAANGAVPAGPAATKELPYGGDVQAAMKAQDRAAIRTIMEHRIAKERGELDPTPAPPAEAPAAPPVAKDVQDGKPTQTGPTPGIVVPAETSAAEAWAASEPAPPATIAKLKANLASEVANAAAQADSAAPEATTMAAGDAPAAPGGMAAHDKAPPPPQRPATLDAAEPAAAADRGASAPAPKASRRRPAVDDEDAADDGGDEVKYEATAGDASVPPAVELCRACGPKAAEGGASKAKAKDAPKPPLTGAAAKAAYAASRQKLAARAPAPAAKAPKAAESAWEKEKKEKRLAEKKEKKAPKADAKSAKAKVKVGSDTSMTREAKARDPPAGDVAFMAALRAFIEKEGPLKSSQLNAFYRANPQVPRKGSGAGTWIAQRCAKHGLAAIAPQKPGGPLAFQLAPGEPQKPTVVKKTVAVTSDDRTRAKATRTAEAKRKERKAWDKSEEEKERRQKQLERQGFASEAEKKAHNKAEKRRAKLEATPAKAKQEDLLYGGDVQEAMRQKDRKAIRALMDHRTRLERGEVPPVEAFLRDTQLYADYAWLVPLLREHEIDMEALALLDDTDYDEMAVDKKTRRVVRTALKNWGLCKQELRAAPPTPAPRREPARAAKTVEPDWRRNEDYGHAVTLHNLSYKTKRYDVKTHISSILKHAFGRVDLQTKPDGTSAGRARVGFRSLREAEAAQKALDGSELQGRSLSARVAAPPRKERATKGAAPSQGYGRGGGPGYGRGGGRAAKGAGRDARRPSEISDARRHMEAEHQKLAAEAKAVAEARETLAEERRALAAEQAFALDERRRVAKVRRERDALQQRRDKDDAHRARAEADFAALQRLELGRRGPPPPRARPERSNSFNATAQEYVPPPGPHPGRPGQPPPQHHHGQYHPGPPPPRHDPQRHGPPPDFAGAVDRSYPPQQNSLAPVRSYSAMRAASGYHQGGAPPDGRFAQEYNNQGGFYGQPPPVPPPQQYAPPAMPPVPPQQMRPPDSSYWPNPKHVTR